MRSVVWFAVFGLLGCVRSPLPVEPALGSRTDSEASGSEARWRYRASVDPELGRMQLGLCIDGPIPKTLVASPEAIDFVRSARVRGGNELERAGQGLLVDTLGDHGCIDLELDLAAMANQGERDATWVGESLMLTPTLWLWHPRQVPEQIDATLELDLPEGVHLTGPWPIEPSGLRRLGQSAFVWAAWTALGRFEPIEFEAAGCTFEVAVLGGRPTASDEGIRNWIRVAAESSAQLFGQFSRDRAAVVVVVANGWGRDPVHFGMARRGGGASAMLILDPAAEDDKLLGEWVATHEFLHFGMPLVAEPWMAEGFVTYYTTVLRARQAMLGRGRERSPFEPELEFQSRLALQSFASGFEDAGGGRRTLRRASESMREVGGYGHVYWGGAALAMDLDLQLRAASQAKRSLDDLIRSMATLIPEPRRWTADELFERFDREVASWREAGELDRDVTPSAIAREHLDARSIPSHIVELEGLAVALDGGDVRLLAEPADPVLLRQSLFAPHPRLP